MEEANATAAGTVLTRISVHVHERLEAVRVCARLENDSDVATSVQISARGAQIQQRARVSAAACVDRARPGTVAMAGRTTRSEIVEQSALGCLHEPCG